MVTYLMKQQKWSSAAELGSYCRCRVMSINVLHVYWIVSAASAQMVSVDDILDSVYHTPSKWVQAHPLWKKCMYRCLILCYRYFATIASIKTPSHTIEVVKLFKALSELGSHPRLVECIEVMARGLALHSQHRDALTLLHEVEDIKVCYIPIDYY